MRNRVCLFMALVVIGTGWWPGHARAQDSAPGRMDVFLAQDPETGAASIHFVDALSGLSTVVSVDNGWRFTLAGNYVVYEKPQSGAIMRATADGTLEPHPFIRYTPDLQAIRWVVSPDGQAIAWVLVRADGLSEAYVAQADGQDWRQLPIASPGAFLVLEPVALTDGMTQFFYDAAHPAESAFVTPYAYFEHITAYGLEDEAFRELPMEPNCPCSAAITPEGRTFARLEATAGHTGPFALHIWDLPSGADIRIPAPDLPYPLGGDLILNRAGTLAAYSVATGLGAEADLVEERYAVLLVDVVTQQQILILAPGPTRYRPVAFIDEDGALMLTSLPDGETYKLDLVTTELQRVSAHTYLGTIIAAP